MKKTKHKHIDKNNSGFICEGGKWIVRNEGAHVLTAEESVSVVMHDLAINENVIMGTYKLNPMSAPDPKIIQALTQRHQHNKKTVIIVDGRLSKEEIRGLDVDVLSWDMYVKTGSKVIVLDQFDYTHIKVLLAQSFVFIGTTNFDGLSDQFAERDFTIRIENVAIISECTEVLQGLLDGKKILWSKYNYRVAEIKKQEIRLSWGPMHHLSHLLEMIALAQDKIYIYQQDMQDVRIMNALLQTADKGVRVYILMSHYPFGPKNGNKNLANLQQLTDAGCAVRLTGEKNMAEQGKPLHVHAKMMLIDDDVMYLGSTNFYPISLSIEKNHLSVGVITRASVLIDRISNIFQLDWDAHN